MSIDIVLRLIIVALGIVALSERNVSRHPFLALIRSRQTIARDRR
jgi:hypothetical protein